MLLSPSASGAENMALDHALVRRAAASGEAVLRVYTWTRPTLSLGRHQTARGVYDMEGVRRRGIDVVRRPTGGGAVLHHREVTYSISTPLAPERSEPVRHRVRDIYDACNRLVLEAIRSLGAPAMLAEGGAAGSWDAAEGSAGSRPAPKRDLAVPDTLGGSPCFDLPTPGELVVAGRKLAGSAQWREGHAVLQHGSILIDDDQQILGMLAPSHPPAAVATLRSLLGRDLSACEVGAALRAALDAVLAQAACPASSDFDLDPRTAAEAEGLRARYASDAWTWRR